MLGSPLVGAFLLMEVIGFGGATMEMVLLPGLLSAGVGSLIFVGLNNLTGFGNFSLDHFEYSARWLAHGRRVPLGHRHRSGRCGARNEHLPRGTLCVLWLSHGECCSRRWWAWRWLGSRSPSQAGTGRSSSYVLFSGQSALPGLVQQAAGWTVGAMLLLVLCKAVAYAISLGSFRGGPIFPAMFIGAAGGIALSHLPGLPMIAGVAMGVGAMTAAALKLPMTAVLLPSLLFISDAVALMPVVIVAVVVAYVAAVWISPSPAPTSAPNSEAAST